MQLPEIHDLSEREQDILRLVATGAGNKQIAAQLFISTNTVKVHLRNIFTKIGVTSRTEAAMVALRLGLVKSAAAEIQAELPAEIETTPEASSVLIDERSLGLEPSSLIVEMRGNVFRRWLAARQVWVLGLVGLALVVVLLVIGINFFSRRNPEEQAVVTSAPKITPLTRWQARSVMPSPRTGLAVVAYEEKLYAIGGETMEGVCGIVERYDPETDTWTGLNAKIIPTADIQAVVLGGMIYVPGGRMPSGELTDALEIYDIGTGNWKRGADMPQKASAYAITSYEGRLFLFGGWDGDKFLDQALLYDPRLDTWSDLSPLQSARGFSGAAVAGGKIYVVGGKDDQKILPVVEVYSPDREGRENPWSVTTPMPVARYGMGIASVADIIYIVCGQGEIQSPQDSLAFISQTDTWQPFDTPPTDLESGLGMAQSGEFLYALGGKHNLEPMNTLLAYQVVYTVGIPVIIK